MLHSGKLQHREGSEPGRKIVTKSLPFLTKMLLTFATSYGIIRVQSNKRNGTQGESPPGTVHPFRGADCMHLYNYISDSIREGKSKYPKFPIDKRSKLWYNPGTVKQTAPNGGQRQRKPIARLLDKHIAMRKSTTRIKPYGRRRPQSVVYCDPGGRLNPEKGKANTPNSLLTESEMCGIIRV